MKLSQFIKELQAIEKEHGDINVGIFTYDGEGESEVPRLCLLTDTDDHDKIVEVTLGDASWVDAFQ
jgi:hypothetical protein